MSEQSHVNPITVTQAEWQAKCEREKELEAEVARLKEERTELHRHLYGRSYEPFGDVDGT